MDIQELKRAGKLEYENRHPWEVCRASIVKHFIKIYAGPSIENIVDIGSGDGYIANRLSQNNTIHVQAIDNAYNNELKYELKNKIANDRVNFYDSLEAYRNNYHKEPEIVLLMDIIEHIKNPVEFLNGLILENKFREATWIITAPAFNSIYSSHDKLLEHWRRYDRKELVELLKSCRFIITASGYMFFSLFIIRTIQYAAEKTGIKKQNAGIEWKRGKFISFLLRSILLLDFFTGFIINKAGIKLPGLSSYAICKTQKSQ